MSRRATGTTVDDKDRKKIQTFLDNYVAVHGLDIPPKTQDVIDLFPELDPKRKSVTGVLTRSWGTLQSARIPGSAPAASASAVTGAINQGSIIGLEARAKGHGTSTYEHKTSEGTRFGPSAAGFDSGSSMQEGLSAFSPSLYGDQDEPVILPYRVVTYSHSEGSDVDGGYKTTHLIGVTVALLSGLSVNDVRFEVEDKRILALTFPHPPIMKEPRIVEKQRKDAKIARVKEDGRFKPGWDDDKLDVEKEKIVHRRQAELKEIDRCETMYGRKTANATHIFRIPLPQEVDPNIKSEGRSGHIVGGGKGILIELEVLRNRYHGDQKVAADGGGEAAHSQP